MYSIQVQTVFKERMAKRQEAQKSCEDEQNSKKEEKKTATGARGHMKTNTVPMTVPRPIVRVAWCQTYAAVGWNDEDTARSWNKVPPDYILA